MSEKQVGGTHYSKYDPQPGFVFSKLDLPFWLAAACKYWVRLGDKGGEEGKKLDIQKFKDCLEKHLESGERVMPSAGSFAEYHGHDYVNEVMEAWASCVMPGEKWFGLMVLFVGYLDGCEKTKRGLLNAV
jgi:hypothetical protein